MKAELRLCGLIWLLTLTLPTGETVTGSVTSDEALDLQCAGVPHIF